MIRLPFRRPPEAAAAKLPPPFALGLDFHNHLLPAVDDGMADLAAAKLTIKGLKNLGFAGAVITPHLYPGVFDNTAAGLRVAFAAFVGALQRDGIDFPLYLAGEYFADAAFLRLVEADDLLHINVVGARWVLLEFPYLQETPYADAALAALVARGYRPVIAHVERYRFVAQASDEWLQKFANADAVLQCDIGSLADQYGRDVMRFAQTLLKRQIVSIWGTDVHHPAQLDRHIVPGLAKLAALGRLNGVLDPILTGSCT